MDTSDEAYVGISEYWEYLTLNVPAAAEPADVAPLDLSDVTPLAGEAVERRVLAGVDAGTAKQIANTIEFHVTDLPGSRLGASGAAGHILLDVNAAGYGWFMDSSPSNDREFQKVIGGSELRTTSESAATGKVDLLTVVMHEFGHQLGLPDLPTAIFPHHIMTETIGRGTRRTPNLLSSRSDNSVPNAQPPQVSLDTIRASLLQATSGGEREPILSALDKVLAAEVPEWEAAVDALLGNQQSLDAILQELGV